MNKKQQMSTLPYTYMYKQPIKRMGTFNVLSSLTGEGFIVSVVVKSMHPVHDNTCVYSAYITS